MESEGSVVVQVPPAQDSVPFTEPVPFIVSDRRKEPVVFADT
jgi:hypothetical protein